MRRGRLRPSARFPIPLRKTRCTGWTVYIAECADSTLYVGITTDVRRRLAEHNTARGSRYTRARRPVQVVYVEAHPNRASATRREAQVRRWTRARKIALVRGQLKRLRTPSELRD